jgi:hypothetical protein
LLPDLPLVRLSTTGTCSEPEAPIDTEREREIVGQRQVTTAQSSAIAALSRPQSRRAFVRRGIGGILSQHLLDDWCLALRSRPQSRRAFVSRGSGCILSQQLLDDWRLALRCGNRMGCGFNARYIWIGVRRRAWCSLCRCHCICLHLYIVMSASLCMRLSVSMSLRLSVSMSLCLCFFVSLSHSDYLSLVCMYVCMYVCPLYPRVGGANCS